MAHNKNKTYKIDQTRTFVSVMLVGTAAKVAYGDGSGRQETNRAGVPRWVAQVVAEFRSPFQQPVQELLSVGIDAETDPGAGIAPGTLMELIDLEIGVMEKRNREDKVIGAQVWYRASAMRPISATGTRPRPVPEAAAR